MKYLKVLGLAAIAAAAMMAFAGTASATELTCSAGTMCTAPTAIHAEVEGTGGVILHPPIGDIVCKKGTVAGRASTGSSATTVESVNAKGEPAELEALTFGECNAEVVVLKKGSLEIHTEYTKEADGHFTQNTASTNNGTLTSTGAEVTVTFSGFHCIFETKSTDIGTLTGSSTTGSTATLDITATIPRTGGRSGAFCGSSAAWTGNYKVDTPDFLDVD